MAQPHSTELSQVTSKQAFPPMVSERQLALALGADCAFLPKSSGSLKMATVGVFTLWKLANATK